MELTKDTPLRAAECACPVLPDVSAMSTAEIDRIIGKPLCCVSCGQELELRCPEGHLHQVPRTRSPNHRPVPRHDPVYQGAERTCLECALTFTPRKYQRTCDRCQATHATGTLTARVYQPKPCAQCGREFQPTGPRALFCKRDDCA